MIRNLSDIKKLREKIRNENKKMVFTNGCFDIVHKGHVTYLNQAKTLGDYLIVGINSDDSVRKLKGKDRPVNNESDRAFVIDNLKAVDDVLIFNEDTPYEIIKEIIPDLLVKGGDWKEEEIVGSDIVKNHGGHVISLQFVNNYSTSNLLKKISSGKS